MTLQRTIATATPTQEQQVLAATLPVASIALPGKLRMPEDQMWPQVDRVIFLLPSFTPRAGPLLQLMGLLDLPSKTPIVLAELGKDARANPPHQKALAALIDWVQDDYPATRLQTLRAENWKDVIELFAQPNDLFVCFAGQRLTSDPFQKNSLGQALFDTFNLPTFELEGALPPWPSRMAAWIQRALFELFPFLVVGFFFWIQFQISGQVDGWIGKALLATTVVLEVALVFIWSLFLS